jgi:plastocyanin
MPRYELLEIFDLNGGTTMNTAAKFVLLACCLMLASVTTALAQENAPKLTQIVALDECDPATFNAAIGPDFCKNVSLGYFTTFDDLFAKAAAGTPDPNWDFEPDSVQIKKGTTLSVVDQGGEPHTFTEVARFGGGFITGLNGPGETTVPECSGGFGSVAVAKTRILQASHLDVTGLKSGVHNFQCCIHPWMRVKVDVK